MGYTKDLDWGVVKALFQIAQNLCEKCASGTIELRTHLKSVDDNLTGGQGEAAKSILADEIKIVRTKEEKLAILSDKVRKKLEEIAAMENNTGKYHNTDAEMQRLNRAIDQVSTGK